MLVGAGKVFPHPRTGRRGKGWMDAESPPQAAARHQLCLGVPPLHVARTVADAVPITTGWSDISMAGVTSTGSPACRQARKQEPAGCGGGWGGGGRWGGRSQERTLLGEIWGYALGLHLVDRISMFCVSRGDNVLGDWHQALS